MVVKEVVELEEEMVGRAWGVGFGGGGPDRKAREGWPLRPGRGEGGGGRPGEARGDVEPNGIRIVSGEGAKEVGDRGGNVVDKMLVAIEDEFCGGSGDGAYEASAIRGAREGKETSRGGIEKTAAMGGGLVVWGIGSGKDGRKSGPEVLVEFKKKKITDGVETSGDDVQRSSDAVGDVGVVKIEIAIRRW